MMKRFMGMMPSSEIKERRVYETPDGRRVRIDAGPNGWTLHWADGGNDFKDVCATTEANMVEAVLHLMSVFPEAKQVENDAKKETKA